LLAAILSMLSLQVVASDHWHGVEETPHCEVCVHVLDADIPSVSGSFTLLNHQVPQVPCSIPVYTAGLKQGVGNRGPPALS
jgi:hypothetical protein